MFVADGYGNRRVIVFDADTGDYKRMWGAFGNTPMAPSEGGDEPAGPEGPPQFGIVHGIEVSSDGLVYVADRGNSRVQVFDADGTYRTQGFVNRGDESSSTVAGLAFSPDAEQQFMYSADQGNLHIPRHRTGHTGGARHVRQQRHAPARIGGRDAPHQGAVVGVVGRDQRPGAVRRHRADRVLQDGFRVFGTPSPSAQSISSASASSLRRPVRCSADTATPP